MDHFNRRTIEDFAKVNEPRRLQFRKCSLVPCEDRLVQADHHADLRAIEALRVAMLANKMAEYLLYLPKAANPFETRPAINRLLRLFVAGFDEPLVVDIFLNVLDRHDDGFGLLLVAPESASL